MQKLHIKVTDKSDDQQLLAFLSMREVQTFLGGKSRSSIYRWIAAGEFPKPIKIGGNSSVWPLETLMEWRKSVMSMEVHNV